MKQNVLGGTREGSLNWLGCSSEGDIASGWVTMKDLFEEVIYEKHAKSWCRL